MTRIFWLGLCAFAATGCASPARRPDPSGTTPFPEGRPIPRVVVDYDGLEKDLNLWRPRAELGFAEKSFDTCTVGRGYPNDQDCRREYFVSIHFQLVCRPNDESEVLDPDRLRAPRGKPARWQLGGRQGEARLDRRGRGQFKGVFRTSQKTQRLKVSVDRNFLVVRAGEIERVITPADWCL